MLAVIYAGLRNGARDQQIHDALVYKQDMRVYVDSQHYAWEFNAIKEAILHGTLTYAPKMAA
jgi:hypothetical protein